MSGEPTWDADDVDAILSDLREVHDAFRWKGLFDERGPIDRIRILGLTTFGSNPFDTVDHRRALEVRIGLRNIPGRSTWNVRIDVDAPPLPQHLFGWTKSRAVPGEGPLESVTALREAWREDGEASMRAALKTFREHADEIEKHLRFDSDYDASL